MIKFLLIAVSLTASILSAKADGNELLRKCSSSNHIDWGFCIGFVDGVVNARYSDTCLPKSGVQRGQARDIVVKFLRDYPEMRHYNEADLVLGAVAAAFPCSKKATS